MYPNSVGPTDENEDGAWSMEDEDEEGSFD